MDRSHPLTARVWVNRLWQYQFGVGIVATSGDFGVQGERPSHPELLDWLAAELIDRGWSTKHIERQILASHAFRQSSRRDPAAAEREPENRYLWHFAPRRLGSETLRDAMLAASGELDCRLGGPSEQKPDEPAVTRRSLYLLQKRGVPPELQKLFDGPAEMAESCTRRHVSTTALQSLYLLNNPFVVARAEALAADLVRSCGDDREAALIAAFERVLSRPPDEDELTACLDLLAAQPADADPARGLVLVCQTLLNMNELAYLE